jgi:uncharacterized membrane protein YfcA
MIAEGYAVAVGGGGILIQFVLLSLGMPLPMVIATDIAGGLGSGLGVIAASPRSIWDNKKLIWLLGIPFLVGGIIGTIFLTKIPAKILRYLLITALAFLIFYMLRQKNQTPQNLRDLSIKLKEYPVIGTIMIGLGVYSNVSGVGAGTFQKIVYSSLLKMKIRDGIGITNIVYMPPTIFSIIVTAITGLLAWPYAITLWIGTFIGANFVARYIMKINENYLRKALVVLAFLYLVYLLWSVL